MSFVSVENLFHNYGSRPILERINLTAEQGEFVSLVGASGCGKSTFLRLLLAQEQPTRGSIRIDGAQPATEPDRARGVVFQRYSVFPHLTVRENIVAGESLSRPFGRFFGAEARAARARADAVLERIGLAHVGSAYPATLSGGMQQRLAIGQALIAKPLVLLLDEPFGALDPGTRLSMHDFLLELRAETGMTVFMVTHDLEEGFKLGDRVLVFDKPRWDPTDPEAYGATITYDFDARNGGIPFQTTKEDIHAHGPN
ncbi:ABC transporter ATP-binding protein [Meridianimarinicoccus aquatilis]|uniref:ATP-binding cassette domain-containing protein n=1 Tax=Meridianimarinicoccus aquatilis TaxID=2552766 RepID=A0A4R6B4M7_9RHOB|nr:ATP-binding cassette domain-containing protein [Fluviibacterium aquatile]QIE43782.1 ATP-binding cassette domain-containing protein [Rhodobacteraceae bacterium SC52]TDL90448.1 ATP-binding cassette domain-containing protein [Fluviibacterium aquatile]